MTKLVLKNRQKNGGARYGLEGVRASAYFPPSMFVGELPESIMVEEATEPVIGPDGQALKDDAGNAVTKGLVFATESTPRPRTGGATTSGVKVNAVLQEAREKAKQLREQSKQVLREARQASKRAAKGAQPSLVEEGQSANV